MYRSYNVTRDKIAPELSEAGRYARSSVIEDIVEQYHPGDDVIRDTEGRRLYPHIGAAPPPMQRRTQPVASALPPEDMIRHAIAAVGTVNRRENQAILHSQFREDYVQKEVADAMASTIKNENEIPKWFSPDEFEQLVEHCLAESPVFDPVTCLTQIRHCQTVAGDTGMVFDERVSRFLCLRLKRNAGWYMYVRCLFQTLVNEKTHKTQAQWKQLVSDTKFTMCEMYGQIRPGNVDIVRTLSHTGHMLYAHIGDFVIACHMQSNNSEYMPTDPRCESDTLFVRWFCFIPKDVIIFKNFID